MQNIKNFTLINPTPEMLEAVDNDGLVLFLISEDGQDWYECQSLFSEDTVKIQYDSSGIIRAVVAEPVPQRGNVYAVSMLWPFGMSVAEIAVADYPEGVTLDGTWKFDGISVYQDADAVAARVLAKNTDLRLKYTAQAALAISTLQAGIAVNRSVEGDSDALTAWQGYLCDLRGMTAEDLQQSPATFPVVPASIF